MFNNNTKTFLLLALIIITICGVSGISAADVNNNITDTSNNMEDTTIQENTDSESVLINDVSNKEITKKIKDNTKNEGEGTFTELEDDITGTDVKLTRDYIQGSYESTIVIKEDKTIDGDGHTITASTNPFSIPVGHEVTFKNMIINGGSNYNIVEVAGSVIFNNVTFDKLSLGTNSLINPKSNAHIAFNNCTINEFSGGSIVRCTVGTYEGVTIDVNNTIFNSPELKYPIIHDQGKNWKINMTGCQFTINNDTTLKNINVTNTKFTVNKGKLEIINSTFTDFNENDREFSIAEGVNVYVENSTFKNIGTQGVFYFSPRSNGDFKNCLFVNCTNTVYGGAITAYGRGTFNVDNCTFINNSAIRGGAIYSKGTLTVKNSTFISNKATPTEVLKNQGGSVLFVEGNLYLYNNTMTDNTGLTAEIYNSYATIYTPVKIVIDDVGCEQGSEAVLTATITDEDGNAIDLITSLNGIAGEDPDVQALAYLNLTVEDNKYNLTRNQSLKGKIARPITPTLPIGTYTINAEVWADEFADATVRPGTLTVTEAPLTNYEELQSMIDDPTSDTLVLDVEVQRGLTETTVNVNKSITIDLNSLTWDANNGQAIEVLNGATLTLKNGVLINVDNSDVSSTNAYGRLARITSGKLVLENITITNCSAPDFSNMYPGSLIRINTASSLTVNNCTITGLDSRFVIDNGRGTININNTLFDNNKLGSVDSLIQINGQTTINNTQFTDNTANWGVIYGNNQKDLLTIDNTSFVGNVISVGAPLVTGADTIVNNSLFYNNRATAYLAKSGGIYTNDGSLTVTHSTFIKNTANDNDGSIIQHTGYTPGDLTVTYSILIPADNRAAIYNKAEDDSIKAVANYNYWGTNTTPSSYVKSSTYEDEYYFDEYDCTPIEVKYWVVMNTSIVPEELSVYDDASIITSYNKYTDGTNYYDMAESIPDMNVNFTFVTTEASSPITVTTNNGIATTTYNVQTNLFAVIATDSYNNNVVYATATNPEPQIITLNDGNWTEYFNDDGTVKSYIKVGSELRFEGTFNDRFMNITKPFNITTADTQAVLNNCVFIINADNVNITKIEINNQNTENPVIVVFNSKNTRIEENNITITNNDDKVFTHAIEVNGGENNLLQENIITTIGPEDDVIRDSNYNTITLYTISIQAIKSNGITINNNTITTKHNKINTSDDTGTIYAIYISGDITEKTTIGDAKITNNNINTESTKYGYSVDVDYAKNTLIENNTITTTSDYYADGIQLLVGNDSIINNNTLTIKADNLSYAIILNGFKDMNGNDNIVSNNTISNNNINIESDNSWAIETVTTSNNTITGNNIIQEAENAVAIGLSDSDNTIITLNNITVTAEMQKAPNISDAVTSYPAGIKINPSITGTKSSDKNTITNNNITITAPDNNIAAINITSNYNTITDNYLIAPSGKGDNAVITTKENNIIQNNEPSQIIITEENYSTYFNNEGIFQADKIDGFNEGDKIILSGEFNDKKFIFNNKVHLTSDTPQATLSDSSITLNKNAAGSTIENLYIDGDTTELIKVNTDNVTIINNTLINRNFDENSNTITLNGQNNTVTNNTLELNVDMGARSGSASVSPLDDNNVYDNLPFNPKTTNIELYDIEMEVDGNETITITVTDEQLEQVTKGKIKVYLDDVEVKSVTLDENPITIELKDLEYGNHTIKAEYQTINEELYSNTTSNATIIVNKKDTKLEVICDEFIDYNGELTIKGLLSDMKENKLNNKTITIKINDKTTNVTTKSGSFDYTFKTDTLGQNNVTVIFGGDNKYNNDKFEFTFRVDPVDTMIVLETVNDTTYSEKVTITGILTNVVGKSLDNEKITIKINNQKHNLTTNNGIFTLTTTANTVGTNNVTVIYEGNYGLGSDQQTTTFTVTKRNTKLTVNKVNNIVYGQNVNIKGKLTDTNGSALASMTVNIKINNEKYNTTTDKNGAYTLTTLITSVGVNNVTISYDGNTYYNKQSTKTTFTISKKNTLLVVDKVSDVIYGERVTVKGKLTDADGKILSNMTVNIKINNKDFNIVTDKNGTYKLTTMITSVGVNNVTLSYAGNTYYNKQNNKTTFNIKKLGVTITINTLSNKKYSENVTITGKVTDSNNKLLYNTKVKVSLNTRSYVVSTDKNGVYTLTTKVLDVGQINATATYQGNDYYETTSTSTKFNSSKQSVIITLDTINTISVGQTQNITGTLTDGNKNPLFNTCLYVNLDGNTLRIKTDSNGKFYLTTKTNIVGTHNLTFNFTGNNYYQNRTVQTTFKVDKQRVIITLEKIQDTAYNNNITIKGKVTTSNGGVLYNTGLNLVLNGKSITLKTNQNGEYSITTPIRQLGTNNITVSFNENKLYEAANAKTTFNVAKKDVKITVNTATYKNGNFTIGGKFTDSTNIAFTNSQVTITLNGKDTYAKTDANGVYTLKGTSKMDQIKYKVSFKGNNYYNSFASSEKTLTKSQN